MMSLPKSWLESAIGGVAAQLLEQEFGVEDIDAHAGQAMSGLSGIGGGSAGFSRKAMMRSCSSTAMTPKAVASCAAPRGRRR